jgi:hypothetical protein
MGKRRIIEPGSAIIASAISDTYKTVRPYAADTFHVRKQISLSSSAAAADVENVWVLPTVSSAVLIDGAWIDFVSASMDGGTKYQLVTTVELAGSGGRVRGIAKSRMPIAWFAAGSPGAVNFSLHSRMAGLRKWTPFDAFSGADVQQEGMGPLLATCVAGTNVFTTQFEHGMANDDACILHETNPPGYAAGTLPADASGVESGTLVYAKSVSSTTFALALTPGGATIDFTTNGTPPFYVEPVNLEVGNGRALVLGTSPFSGATLRARGVAMSALAGAWATSFNINLVGRLLNEF